MCEVKTTDDKCCVFPFIYDGEKRYTCISKGHWRKWCATTGNYDENDDDWGNCAGAEAEHGWRGWEEKHKEAPI